MVNPRIKKLTSLFEQKRIDALLITEDVNITYLTRFPASESWLLVCPQKSFYLTDFRYILEAQKGLKGVHIQQYTKSMADTLFKTAKSMRVKRLGFDGWHLSLAQYKALKRQCPKSIKLKDVQNCAEHLRQIKDSGEIRNIRKALKIHKEALVFLKKIIKPGTTEQEIYVQLDNFVKAKGVGFSFDPIVASGPNSCYPHAKVTGRRLRQNELVLLDMGIDYKGYKSDLTRMFLLGKISELVEKVNTYVRDAQQKAIDIIRPGVSVAKVDRAARSYLAKQNLAKFFGHALGHGVGLQIHEAPRLAQQSKEILREGMVVTVEPAVYIPNKFGVRIEDMVLVTKNGCEVLSGDID